MYSLHMMQAETDDRYSPQDLQERSYDMLREFKIVILKSFIDNYFNKLVTFFVKIKLDDISIN